MKMKNGIIQKHGIIVSCQALEGEPLYGAPIMAKMALAAKLGGAKCIRANSGCDIKAIKQTVDLPVIGIVKREYLNSAIYITPTMKEVDEVAESGAEIVAIDATCRNRPDGSTLEEFIKSIRAKYPSLHIMADISTYEEGVKASQLGVDVVSTTLSGYTEETKSTQLPNINLVRKLSRKVPIPVIAEGGIRCPRDLKRALRAGAYSVVIGSAITRPHLITKSFVEAVSR